jgi:transcriptional regulator with XRE-family HTH domain
MHTTPAIFGKRLTDILRQKGWSQSDLAAMIWGRKPDSRGFQVAQKRDLISSYCKGEMLPSRDNLQKIAEKLDMTADELLPAAQLQPLQDIGVIQSQTKRDDPRSVIWNARIDISKELATFFEEMYARFCEAREKGETFKLPRL